jgi:hypothetical protein
MSTSIARLGKRGRPETKGPELDLLTKAVSNGLLRKQGFCRAVFYEPSMPTGYPDLIVAYYAKSSIRMSCARKTLSTSHIRLAHQIYCSKGAKIEELAKLLGLSGTQAEALVEDLEASGLVYRKGRFVRTKSIKRIFPVRQIVSVECKVGSWRRALRQAVGNTWFASESYILLPKTAAVSDINKEAIKAGIGVMLFDGQKTLKVLSAEKRPQPASYGSWLVNEWVVSGLGREGT